LERISNSTHLILEFLKNHPCIDRIYYPFLKDHPQSGLAEKQMQKGSGLFTIKTRTEDTVAIENFCNALSYWRMAVSWGGYESLVIPSCTFVRPGLYTALPANLIRFSVGLEEPEALIADLDRCLSLLDS
jgi:cystathionine beta-lyase/cystathionine gamma-synthase